MLKKSIIFMTAILFIGVIQVSAMGSGHGSSGGCSGYGSGSMKNHMDDVMESGAYDSLHNSNWHQDGSMEMNGQTAETMMRSYMEDRNVNDRHFDPQMDHGSSYMIDIIGSNGEVTDRLVIDKESGNIHSVERR